jgi:hypothetical protein
MILIIIAVLKESPEACLRLYGATHGLQGQCMMSLIHQTPTTDILYKSIWPSKNNLIISSAFYNQPWPVIARCLSPCFHSPSSSASVRMSRYFSVASWVFHRIHCHYTHFVIAHRPRPCPLCFLIGALLRHRASAFAMCLEFP